MQQQFNLDYHYNIKSVSGEMLLPLKNTSIFNHIKPETPFQTIEKFLKNQGFASFICRFRNSIFGDKCNAICSIQKNKKSKQYPFKGWLTPIDHDNFEEKYVQKDLEFQNFIYKVSHNIQGPVKSMKGIVKLAEMENDLIALKKYFESFEQLTDKLDHLINRLIEIVNINAGLKAAVHEIDLDQIIFDVLNTLHENSDISTIFFRIDNKADVPFYNQHFLIKLVFSHLISNAVEAFKGQEGYEIKINLNTDKFGNLSLEIGNNGPEIPECIAGQVFEMFYKGDKHGHHQGLGLYLVKTILEMLEGTIALENEPNAVSFKVSIPNQYYAIPA